MKSKTLLIEQIRDRAIQFGEVQLSSGLKSDYFIDLSKILYDRFTIDIVNDLIAAIPIDRITRVGGIALGGAPLAFAYSFTMDYNCFLVRKEQKNGSYIEGNLEKGDNVLLLEDVVTTGKQIERACEIIESYGAKVVKAVSVVDRSEDFKSKWNYEPIVYMREILCKFSLCS